MQTCDSINTMKLGYYKHYKNKHYKVLGTVLHSETLEEMVLYQALYGEQKQWVRPKEMFLETIEINNQLTPRFQYIGEHYTA